MNISAGSIESSDIKIVIEEGHAAMQCMNMVPELTDRLVYEFVAPILKEYGLADLSPQIWFNGANEWVVRSRCEALRSMLNASLEREEVTG